VNTTRFIFACGFGYDLPFTSFTSSYLGLHSKFKLVSWFVFSNLYLWDVPKHVSSIWASLNKNLTI